MTELLVLDRYPDLDGYCKLDVHPMLRTPPIAPHHKTTSPVSFKLAFKGIVGFSLASIYWAGGVFPSLQGPGAEYAVACVGGTIAVAMILRNVSAQVPPNK
jgi:hypothetical protein